MAAYRYDTPVNPYVPSIAELLAHGGDAPARAAELAAAARARATEIGGQAWGRAAEQIGQIPTQIQAARDADAQRRLRDIDTQKATLEAGQMQRAVDGQKLLGSLIQQHTTTDAFGVPSVDHQAIANDLSAKGYPDAAEKWLGTTAANADNIEKIKGLQRQTAAAIATAVGKAANKADSPGDFLSHLGLLHVEGIVPPDVIQHVTQELQAAGDQGWAAKKQQYIANAEALSAPVKLGKDDKLVSGIDPSHVIADNSDPNEGAYTINGQRFKKDGTPIGAVQPTQTPTSFEHKSMSIDGKPNQSVDFDPHTRQYFAPGSTTPIDLSQHKITENPPATVQINNLAQGALSNLPSWATDDSRPVGPDANKFDPSVRMTPNGLYQAALTNIATGQFPQTGRGNDPSAQAIRAAITSKVGAIAAAAGLDEPTLRALYRSNSASLTQQQKAADSVQAFMSTADRNAALLKPILDQIPDVGSPLLNQPLRAVSQKAVGNADLSKFRVYVQSIQNEYARILTQPNLAGVLSDSARTEAAQLIDPNATVKQIVASITALNQEGNNRLLSLGDQLQRIQQRMTVGGSASPAAASSGTIRAKDPQGHIHEAPAGTALPAGWVLQ